MSAAAEPLPARLRSALRDVRDFPKPGIVFKDITPVLAEPALFASVIDAMAAPFAQSGITHVAGIESRGFILGAPLALALRAAFVPIRKPGKLPWKTAAREYDLEYGTDRLEMHLDACASASRVLVVDDVLATGGTAAAACELVEQVGAQVIACALMLEIRELGGRGRLAGRRVETLLAV